MPERQIKHNFQYYHKHKYIDCFNRKHKVASIYTFIWKENPDYQFQFITGPKIVSKVLSYNFDVDVNVKFVLAKVNGIAVEADEFICKISELNNKLKYVNMSAYDIDVRKKKKFGFSASCFERKHQLVLLCRDPDCKIERIQTDVNEVNIFPIVQFNSDGTMS
jgi:hypothetical protein